MRKVTAAFLVPVGAAESGRPTLVFLTKEAVRVALDGVAPLWHATAARRLPPCSNATQRPRGRYYVCPICFDAKRLDKDKLIDKAEIAGAVPMWEWIRDEGATTFSYRVALAPQATGLSPRR